MIQHSRVQRDPMAIVSFAIVLCVALGFLVGGTALADPHDSLNMTRLGQWAGGPSQAIQIDHNLAVHAVGGYLVTYDVGDPAEPRELARVTMPDRINDMAVDGLHAYVSCFLSGLVVVDLSDPTSPAIVARYNTAGHALTVELQGELAFVGHGGGFSILDVSDPENPTAESTVWCGDVFCIAMAGRYAYVCSSGLRIYDVASPSNPVELSLTSLEGWTIAVAVEGRYAYVGSWDRGLYVIDVADPATPAQIGHYDTPTHTHAVEVRGTYAYLADGTGGFRLVDIADPTNPVPLSQYDSPGYGSRIDLNGPWACLSDGSSGVEILRSEELVPGSWVSSVIGRLPAWGGSRRAYLDGFRLYVATDATGIQILDMSDPAMPIEAGQFSDATGAKDAVVQGSFLYVAEGSDGLRTADISDPASPHQTGLWNTAGSARDVVLYGDLLVIADHDRVTVLDKAGQEWDPQFLGELTLSGECDGVAMYGDIAVLSAGAEGVHVVSLAQPDSPVLLATLPLSSQSYEVIVDGDIAYVGTELGLAIVSLAVPSSPQIVSHTDFDGSAHGLAKVGTTVYLASFFSGTRMIDVSDPSTPVETGYYATPAYSFGVVASGGTVYVCNDDLGVHVLHDDLYTSSAIGDEVPAPSRAGVLIEQVHPNPFNSELTIRLAIHRRQFVSVDVYDLQGRHIRQVAAERLDPGYKSIPWDSTNEDGGRVATGIYLVKVVGDFGESVRRVTLLK
ncbi:MAG: T9SS type A sorting domain-containing protein [Candidatus Eisenbacteria bacterium]|uniref:T9SS type A sorting domain-containing protein n=1 Tax=Eiseniibacteriota bacterium TaxID=2212470 RepID=A0A956SF57_UNCEI|nr:T9SS type A sorting domain-containing protein [Candidatus Eisenbacteria bacterium]